MLLSDNMVAELALICAAAEPIGSTAVMASSACAGHRTDDRRRNELRGPSSVVRCQTYDDLSQASVRFGQPALAPTYSLAWDSINGITLSLIGSIQSEALVHFLPSHFAR